MKQEQHLGSNANYLSIDDQGNQRVISLDTEKKKDILRKFFTMIFSAVIGSIYTISSLPLPLLLNPAFNFIVSLAWLASSYSFAYRAIKNKNTEANNQSVWQEMIYGLSTGVFLSSFIVAVEILAPGAVLTAFMTTGAIFAGAFTYLLFDKLFNNSQNTDEQSGLWQGLAKSISSLIVIGCCFSLMAAITGSSIFIFADALLGAVWFTGVLLYELHTLISEDLSATSTSYYAFNLFLTVLNIFMDVCRIIVELKNENNRLSTENISKILYQSVGILLVGYYLVTNQFGVKTNKPRNSDEIRSRERDQDKCHAGRNESEPSFHAPVHA